MSNSREVVEAIYGRWNRNDGDRALDLFHPEVEVHQMNRMFDSQVEFHGHEGLTKSADELGEAFETITWLPERWTEQGDCLVVWLRGTGKGAHSGIETPVDMAHLWRVENGLVTVLHVYETEDEALKAAGGEL